MKRALASTLLVSTFALSPLACSGEDPSNPPTVPDYVMDAEGVPFGKTYGEWSNAWWLWALSIPKDTNPIAEGDCDQQQSGDVFFLAGNMGGASKRTCTIPAGKAIFFPIVNLTVTVCPEVVNADFTCDMATSEQSMQDNAESYLDMNQPTMTLEVDGHAITALDQGRAQTGKFIDPTQDYMQHVFQSPCSGPIRDNTCNMPVGSDRAGFGDGYWVMLNELPAGKHTVHFTAKVPSGPDMTFELDVSYDLTIAP